MVLVVLLLRGLGLRVNNESCFSCGGYVNELSVLVYSIAWRLVALRGLYIIMVYGSMYS